MNPLHLAAISAKTKIILSNPTWDLILVFVFLAIGFFYGISKGRYRTVSTILYTYVALALVHAISFPSLLQMTGIQKEKEFVLQIAVFLFIFFTLAVLLARGKPRIVDRAFSWWQMFLLSFLQTGLLIHIILSFLPPEYTREFAPLTKTVFAHSASNIWWLVGPLAVLAIIRRLKPNQE